MKSHHPLAHEDEIKFQLGQEQITSGSFETLRSIKDFPLDMFEATTSDTILLRIAGFVPENTLV